MHLKAGCTLKLALRACSGTAWVRAAHGEDLRVVRPYEKADDKKAYLREMEQAVTQGLPLLLENLGESLDPVLEPLLQKAVFKAGNLNMVRLGDGAIEYATDFRLILATKLASRRAPKALAVTIQASRYCNSSFNIF